MAKKQTKKSSKASKKAPSKKVKDLKPKSASRVKGGFHWGKKED